MIAFSTFQRYKNQREEEAVCPDNYGHRGHIILSPVVVSIPFFCTNLDCLSFFVIIHIPFKITLDFSKSEHNNVIL